jgi:hypothetical protein
MPYDPKTNKWVGTTRRLNRENSWQDKSPKQELRDHKRRLYFQKTDQRFDRWSSR